MEVPTRKIVRLLIDHDPASPEFRNGVREVLPSRPSQELRGLELNVWKDVFVDQRLPWQRFVESFLLHASALVLVWTLSIVWLRQQRILAPLPFDKSSLITYSPEEYLPPLDTGTPEAPKPKAGDPIFAKQPILSVPREADNRAQTIVVPPNLKLEHDVPMPNIVATGAVAPVVPLTATSSLASRAKAPDPQVVAPAPELDLARDRVTQAALKSDIIPPTPDLKNEAKRDRSRGLAGPESAVIEPPPDLVTPAKGRVGSINIGPSTAVAPAPQLPVAEQHALNGRGEGGASDALANAQAVAPPPSVSGGAGGAGQGRLIALGIHPVVPTGPVAVPAGNRRGAFEANPKGKPGAAGTPDFAGSKSGTGSNGTATGGSGLKGRNSSLPSGLHVGAVSGQMGPVQREGSAGGDGSSDPREIASAAPTDGRRAASTITDDKVTDVDRQVFGDRRPFGTTLNMPNLNSSTGSWIMHFAELQAGDKNGDLLQPLPTEKSDPGYPLELIRANVHGTVTLYAVIHADGRIDDIRVLSSPDDRLDAWATSALAHWKFLPALRAGKPVPIEAVVEIPFRVRQNF